MSEHVPPVQLHHFARVLEPRPPPFILRRRIQCEIYRYEREVTMDGLERCWAVLMRVAYCNPGVVLDDQSIVA
eukprot:CAMPEP_0185778884 /NCGR_PEP_ID=MMETSP1174-20130828/93966_1 /TAXON_ID=35687 /ORGANISM="Dictyocha speculum, Strain CCMP1381" /LENGTH=72 /DNA_ID=CAMNT_0028467795 /DNA_START=364 /DNA_END=582 /DNA_ORIENTATION=+